MQATAIEKNIARNIEEIIKRKRLKKNEVAIRAGYETKQQFANLLHGRARIKADDILNIATALDVTPNELFKAPWDGGGE